jgi:ABC-type dipeptide/oligopeptide/nickel transport system ATPase subunit
VSPTALPQKPAVSLNPQLAFEALLSNAFRVREEIRQKTAATMVALDKLAVEASNQKRNKDEA